MPRQARKGRRGFTLIELLVVCAIIGILATIALTKIQRAILKAREAQTRTNLDTLRKAVDMYHVEQDIAPGWMTGTGTMQWSNQLVSGMKPYLHTIPDNTVCPNRWEGGYFWNIVDTSVQAAGSPSNGWRYGGMHYMGFVSVNDGTYSTTGVAYSSW